MTTITLASHEELATEPRDRGARRAVLYMAGLLVAAPVVRMLGVAIHPLDTADAGATLELIDQETARWAVAHILEPLGYLLMGLSAWVLLRLVGPARRRITAIGVGLYALGCSATALLVYAHGEAYLHMSHQSVEPADMVALYARFDEGVPLAAPFIPAMVLGSVLLAVGLWRSRAVPRGVAVLLPVATVFPNAVGQSDLSLPVGAVVGSIPILVVTVVCAVALVRRFEQRVR